MHKTQEDLDEAVYDVKLHVPTISRVNDGDYRVVIRGLKKVIDEIRKNAKPCDGCESIEACGGDFNIYYLDETEQLRIEFCNNYPEQSDG